MKEKSKDASKNIRLGAMVLAAMLALITGLYLIGDKRNLFGHTFTLKAFFADVNGLTAGNNVRLSGIDVGTVKEIRIVSDTLVEVTMVVEEKVRQFIRKNATAYIGSDGVMGNKLVGITPGRSSAPVVSSGDALQTIRPINMDETTRTLSLTNDNLQVITSNLKHMSYKLDSSALWSVLADSSVADNVKTGAQAFGESMEAIRNSFIVKGLQKKEKRKEKKEEKKEAKKEE